MKKQSEPILVVGDSGAELDEIRQHLEHSYSQVHVTRSEEEAIHRFESVEAAVILLAFRSLYRAETFYLKLFHHCERIYEIPHQVIVFIARGEMERAYELCRREIFHSFVIVRPLLSEHLMLLSVSQARERRASHLSIQRGRRLLRRLGRQVERMHEEFDRLIIDNRLLQERHRNTRRSLVTSIKNRLGVFRDSLMSPRMKAVVAVHDSEALYHEFEHLQEEEVASRLEYYHGKMDEAYGSWVWNLEKHLQQLERFSNEVILGQQPTSPQILIIDDDDVQRHMLTTLLEERGYTMRQASNGNEGMSMLRARTPDLVLLDYEMPDLDGAALLRRARESRQLMEVPFIMITGHHEKEVVKLCLKYGANDYLIKPVDIGRLYKRLAHYFPGHSISP